MNKPALGLLTVALSALFTGCASMGPAYVRSSRPDYNVAVQQTNNQELLLNLVRCRYRDPLYFTTVERIAATQEMLRGATAGGGRTTSRNEFVSAGGANAVERVIGTPLSLTGTVSINEKPTIFYAPIEGEKFVRQMMNPMNPDLLLMLVKSGWSLDRVFSVGVAELNGLKNAPTASGPTPSREPEFRDFREAVRLLRALQREQLIDLIKASDEEGLALVFAPAAADREETGRLKALLGLNPALSSYRVQPGARRAGDDRITVATRPLISAMNYLAQGVEVPERHYTSGKIRRTTTAQGQPFDWQEMLGDVFRVQVSDRQPDPDQVATAISYRGAWFYIADDDLDSKSTFVLLTQLMSLHSAPPANGPAMNFSF